MKVVEWMRERHTSAWDPLLLTNHRIPVCVHVLVNTSDQKPVHLLQLFVYDVCFTNIHVPVHPKFDYSRHFWMNSHSWTSGAGNVAADDNTMHWLHIHCHLRNFQKSKS